MTIQGAITELQNLLNADNVPFYYKGGIKKVIETIQMELADRKTEPTISKMEQVDKDINVRSKDEPQTCETCKWGEWYRKGYDITMMDDECGGCCSWRSKWTPKDEQSGKE